MKIGKFADRMISPFAKYLWDDYMKNLGISTSTRISKTYNRLRYRRAYRRHRKAAEYETDALLRENREKSGEPDNKRKIRMEDGYFIDRSKSLPFLNQLLEDTGKIIHRPGGRIHTDIQRPYFRNLLKLEDNVTYSSFLDFPLSSAVLEPVIEYMGTIPILARTRPPGLRLMESNDALDDRENAPLEMSQLFHIDLYDDPLVYVVVLAEDVTEDCGPWSFLPRSASDRVQSALKYRQRGAAYRVPDDTMFEIVDREELIVFTGKKGDVLFIDTSRCFHYGSRMAVSPRFLMMYGYTSPARTDLSMTFFPPYPYQMRDEDSTLRKMAIAPL